jgi:predicted RNase H-like nuclease (RuvC/YqgF family)
MNERTILVSDYDWESLVEDKRQLTRHVVELTAHLAETERVMTELSADLAVAQINAAEREADLNRQLLDVLTAGHNRIAELERKLNARVGKVERVAHPSLDAILQPTVSVSADSRLWA